MKPSLMSSNSIERSFYFLFLFLSLLLFSCVGTIDRETIKVTDSFPAVVDLRGNSIPEIHNDFYPLLIGLCDSIILFCDTENDPHFHVYKVPDIEYLGSFGQQGKGPNDIHDPVFWGQFQKTNNTIRVWVYQMNLMKFTLIDINEYLESNKKEPEQSLIMPPEINDAVNIIALSDSILIGGGWGAGGEFFMYNIFNESLEWMPFYAAFDNDYCEYLMGYGLLNEYNTGVIKIRPDNKRFIKAFYYKPIIDIYDGNANILFSIMSDNMTKPKVDEANLRFDGDTPLYYMSTYLTDRYIYALNLNCSLAEYGNGHALAVEIDVFDWDGNAICKYRLNEGISETGAFVVDEINHTIYTVNPKSEFDYYSLFELNESSHLKKHQAKN